MPGVAPYAKGFQNPGGGGDLGIMASIYVFALMGGVEIIVPPDVRLESDGFAIMGGFEDQLTEPASTDPNVPLVRVHGMAIMGGVEARVAAPGDDGQQKPG